MKLKRVLSTALACTLALLLLCPAALAAQGSSGRVVSIALSQLGYTERSDEFTKYGQWYGISKGYWCDMFVSWCANQAQVSREIFPPSASCTAHMKLFIKQNRYAPSAARGGNYVPQQGDLIFFYDPILSPDGSQLTHVGIVLYTENGYVYTIEGNAVANRLDRSYEEVAEKREDDKEPADYVISNRYPLDASQIHGYAFPDYADRTPLNLTGFADLGCYASYASQFSTLSGEGIMQPTSSHTFSPHHGMTRGEFLSCVMTLFGLSGWNETTMEFADVSADSACYDAMMTARCAGIIQGAGSNKFLPDDYISGAAAQAIISNTLAYVGLSDRTFQFSAGDLAYICGTYTIRADLAKALYALRQDVPLPAAYGASISLDGTQLDWSPVQINGTCYVALDELQQQFPDLSAVSEESTAPAAAISATTENEGEPSDADSTGYLDPETGLPSPLAACDRVIPTEQTFIYGTENAAISVFTWNGQQYLKLRDAAALLHLDLLWDGDAFSISLTTPTP